MYVTLKRARKHAQILDASHLAGYRAYCATVLALAGQYLSRAWFSCRVLTAEVFIVSLRVRGATGGCPTAGSVVLVKAIAGVRSSTSSRASGRARPPVLVLREERGEWLCQEPPTPIEGFAMLADGASVALLDPQARLAWMCHPRADSDAVFAALLGGGNAGHFTITL